MEHIEGKKFEVSDDGRAIRLDVFLSSRAGVTRSQVQKWIKRGAVFLNGAAPKKFGVMLVSGDMVSVLPEKIPTERKEQFDIHEDEIMESVKIIAQSENYLLIDKPSGLVSHPGLHILKKEDITQTVSVSSWILRHWPELWSVGEYPNRPGMVHRLDKETSGLMLIAKHQAMFDHLKKQFKGRRVEKYYFALIHGRILEEHGILDFDVSLGKNGKMVSLPKCGPLTLDKVSSAQEGKKAKTEFWVKERFVNHTFVEVRTHTGRTHQIRVHFFAFNHPLAGDPLYYHKKTKKDVRCGSLFLQAYRLCFDDLNGERLSFEIPLEPRFRHILDQLPKLRPSLPS
ncbi:MAG: RluA family pseudouridine synthase [Candidatus Magasanikbacteria bacterium]|nr:RluA family pseudouridine synthase [Candidatus Magasanikbacteria bacterium]